MTAVPDRPARAERARAGSPGQVRVGRVMLLGVAVGARAVLDRGEDERRRAAGLAAVTDPALLCRLLELPAGLPARDPAGWAETSALPPGIVARDEDGHTVRRLLEPALILLDVTVAGRPGRELEAVQRASLFAGFTARWAALAGPAPEVAVLEAMVSGVGLAGPGGQVLVPAEPPLSPGFDGWAWLLAEKAYRAWRAGR